MAAVTEVAAAARRRQIASELAGLDALEQATRPSVSLAVRGVASHVAEGRGHRARPVRLAARRVVGLAPHPTCCQVR